MTVYDCVTSIKNKRPYYDSSEGCYRL